MTSATDSRAGNTKISRRRFVVWGASVTAVAAVVAACRDLLTRPSADIHSSRTNTTDHRSGARRMYADYPAPSYVPPAYTLFEETDARPDGFRGPIGFGDGINQLASVYRGPILNAIASPQGQMFAILLFFATKVTQYRFSGTEKVRATPYPLTFSDGTQSIAQYFDGVWSPQRVTDARGRIIAPSSHLPLVWRRHNLHALVFRWHEYVIGIRASRFGGVPFDELIRIASSTARL